MLSSSNRTISGSHPIPAGLVAAIMDRVRREIVPVIDHSLCALGDGRLIFPQREQPLNDGVTYFLLVVAFLAHALVPPRFLNFALACSASRTLSGGVDIALHLPQGLVAGETITSGVTPETGAASLPGKDASAAFLRAARSSMP
jgi:hypothetical protein